MRKIVMSITIIYSLIITIFNGLSAELPDYVVVSHDTIVRVEPTIDSLNLMQLPLAHKIRLIVDKGKIRDRLSGVDGEWVFIDTKFYARGSDKETVKGWVFNSSLASDSYFNNRRNLDKISTFRRYNFEFKGWDQTRKWEIRPNGSFKYQYYSFESKSERGVARGHLYRHKDLIIAYLEPKGAITEYFYLKDDGSTLCCTWPDQNGEIICVDPLK